MPGFEPPVGWPSPREPGVRVRVVPNEKLVPGPLGSHLGELVQRLLEGASEYGVSVEVDTSDRTRPGERRGGADPVEALLLVVYGLAAREALRIADRLFDAALDWVLAHRQQNFPEPVLIDLYGPDGEIIKRVEVPQDGGDPVERDVRDRATNQEDT
jgi:hypothetical protein